MLFESEFCNNYISDDSRELQIFHRKIKEMKNATEIQFMTLIKVDM